MAGIQTDPRSPAFIPADMYVCFGCALPKAIRKDIPFSRSIYRRCPNAWAAITRAMKAKKRDLGEAIVSKDRMYREKRVKGQRFFDVYVVHIPIRENPLQEEAEKPVLLKAINSMAEAIIERGYRVRIAVLSDIHQHISNNDAFEVGLYIEKVYRALGDKVNMVVSLGDHTTNPNNRYRKDEYGWVARR